MPTTSRRKNPSVIQGLLARPFEYSFRQAVRLLERAAAYYNGEAPAFAKNPVARYTPPGSELVRFHTRQSFSFPASEISGINEQESKVGNNQWHMHINFMGLTGSSGVMPYHYSELVQKRLKLKDKSMMDFFDLFNHRLISLFYQASVKYNLPLEQERKKLPSAPAADSSHTKILLALIGLGTNGLSQRLYTKDESFIFYSGLLTKKVRTSTGLKQIIYNHFSIPVEIKEFIGQWQELIDDVRTRLPGAANPRGQNNQLGKSVMLGRKGWFAQGKIRIILGPLTKEQLLTFAPGTSTLKALDEIVRLYINFEHDYDYVMRIKRNDIPGSVKLSGDTPPVLGWNTLLSPRANSLGSRKSIIDIPVSARRLL